MQSIRYERIELQNCPLPYVNTELLRKKEKQKSQPWKPAYKKI